MSGHSKWSTIKRKKGKIDQERGKIFSKLIREIMMAVKIGGADQEANARLRLAIQKAKEENMPNDNLKRAIQKGSAASESANLEEILFEAYAPFGVALLISTVTDNKNRTVPNIRSVLTKYNGSMAAKGAVSYLFDKKGIFLFEPGADEEKIMEVALDGGADDVDTKEDGSIEVLTQPNCFEQVKELFDKNNLSYASNEITWIPKTVVNLDKEQARKILKLIDKMEEDDDVQAVYSNHDVTESILMELDEE
ncbi:MAG: YebC/PmpR family DNA-binding transcriptional regulator [Candidatus Margulisiibacteriota bacterium]|jgi:YebC/PmpR family DNA-binding regulatory protein